MKARVVKIPVGERALFARINRALAKEDAMLKRSREGSRTAGLVGRYYVIDCRLHGVIRQDVRLEEYARELGVLADHEALSDEGE